MAYTPKLSPYHSATSKRVAWALGKPMTKTINIILDNLDRIIDPTKVCDKCRDRSRCAECYFNTGKRINEPDSLNPLKPEIKTEVDMKVNQVSVLVSKKIGKNYCSWSLSYGASATLDEDEHYTDIITQLDTQLREMVSAALPTPNGNNHAQLNES